MTTAAHMLEQSLLVLVTVHAVRHLPEEMNHCWQRMQRHRPTSSKPWNLLFETGVMILTGLAGLISAAPFFYYGFECIVHLIQPAVA